MAVLAGTFNTGLSRPRPVTYVAVQVYEGHSVGLVFHKPGTLAPVHKYLVSVDFGFMAVGAGARFLSGVAERDNFVRDR